MKYILLLLLIFITTNTFSQTEYYITSSDQTKLYVQEFGSGEPLILLAGGPGLNAIYMESIWKNLSLNYRCIVLDQRGTGKSILPKVDSISLTMQNYIRDLEVLREELKLDKITLIGHSWGGMLAMEYAAKYPEKLERLILLGPGGPTNKFFLYLFDNINMRLYDEDIKETRYLDSLKLSTYSGIWPGYFFDRTRALNSKTVIDFEALIGQPGVDSFTITNYFTIQNDRVNLLRNYNGIVHIIQGRQDPIGESTVYEIKDLLPQSQIHFIEKCGHFPWLENENQVSEFYNQLNSALN